MPQEGRPAFLKYRILDPNSGAVVIPDLYHLHQSTWTVRAPQGGMPGNSTIGDFTIKLPPPLTEQGKANRAAYNLLAVGQKVEGYLGDVITGTPKFSGVITKLHKPLAAPWEINGADTLWWLQQSQLFQGESIAFASQPANSILMKPFLGTREVVWDDDFVNWASTFGPNPVHPNSTDYSMSGTWNWASNDGIYGVPAILPNMSGSPVHWTKTTWPIGQQFNADSTVTNAPAASSIKATGVVLPGTTAVNQETSFGVVALCNGTQMLLTEAVLRQTALGPFYTWAIDARIWTSDGAGTFTQRAQVQNVFTYNAQGNSTPTIPMEVEMTLNTSERVVRIIVNGSDSNCTWAIDKTLLLASGGVGVRSNSSGGGAPKVQFNRLRFESRTAQAVGGWGTDRFQQGAIAAGANPLAPAVVSGGQQTHLDMMLMAASYDGFQIRKNPGAGPKADILDYNSSPGTDLSSSIVFEEGVNIKEQGTAVAALAEMFSHATRVNGIPGGSGGSGGQVTYAPFAANGSMALHDSVSDLGLANYQILTAYARLLSQRKANVMQAVQVEVIRTAETADKWRELDFVTVHIPTLGVYRQKAQILGYTFTEGEVSQILHLNQFSDRHLIQHYVSRIQRSLEFIGTTFARR